MEVLDKSQLKVGDKLLRNVYTTEGVLLLTEDTILDQRSMEKLRNTVVSSIHIETQDDKNKEVFAKEYSDSLVEVEELVDNVRKGGKANFTDIKEMTDNVLDNVATQPNVLQRLQEIKSTDKYTYQHSLNVSVLVALFGKWLNLSQDEIRQLSYAGLLHDIGKAYIDLKVLNKPGRLTSQEFDHMKKHSQFGYQILQSVPQLSEAVKQAVLLHHERQDGSGYPFRLKGDKIPLFAKMVSIADSYDALTSDRVYQSKRNPFKANEIIREESFKHLDTALVHLFMYNICEMFVGNRVKLSNGERGTIVLIDRHTPTRPLVKTNETYHNLSLDFKLEITDLVDDA